MNVDRPINPIAPTSRWMAAARARESERADRLFYDPLAAALAGPEGFAWLERMEAAARSDGPGLYPVIRTRFFDDFLLDSCRRLGVRQVVLAAAGLDTRAFRLDWPSRTRLYEMDLPEVLDAKEDVIDKAGAKLNCERRTVRVDLREATWPEALLACGYRPETPSVWVIEGLLYYLTRAAVHRLLEKVGALTATGSFLGLDVMNRGLFFSLVAWPMQAALARLGAPGRFGTNDPERLMARHGWEADVTQPGEEGANFGRWPRPMLPREVPGLPRSFLVRARRS
ncbi:MAG: O-methyltransferase [uncultured Rubrobacteraceae bacterium]|uniref:S-adenosyl-L-methionine-dependent methyltransferase n=1 Tax=uncultured Rubrobacteraceae bacterium TaxID=349277 RepID=A0A6J4PLH9_9ACTN|nr:MAG: O-methyltransferase [uncultured Rubrobacteraceae bacterium]